MNKKSTSDQPLRMFDHSIKLYVRIQLSKDKKYYEKWVSKNKEEWKLVDKLESLDQVMSTKRNVIDNNYLNLFSVVLGKK